jgi:O-antigen/teichoic acid export membrane protein
MRSKIREWIQDDFIRHAGLVAIGMQFVNVFNLLYHLVVVRMLSYEDYGALNALVIFALYFSQIATPFQTSLMRSIAIHIGLNERGRSRFLIKRATIDMAIASAIVIAAFWTFAGPFARMQQIGDSTIALLVGLLVASSFMVVAPQAYLQGAQSFAPLMIFSASATLLKLIVGIGLVWAGFGVRGGLWGFIACPLSMMVAGYFAVSYCLGRNNRMGEKDPPVPMSPIYSYCLPVGLMLISFALLTNVDVTLVKKYFSPLEAGYYSVAQMAGKIILFLPGAVSFVVFPKAASAHARRSPSFHLLKKGLIAAALICGAGTIVCLLFPARVLGLLAGKTSAESVALVPWFATAMSMYALVWVAATYNLSINNVRFIKYVVALAVLQIAAICVYHPGLKSVLGIVNVCALVSLVTTLSCARTDPSHSGPAEDKWNR